MRSYVRKSLSVVFALAACLAIGVATYAAITFDPVAGIGFVGKGDVQYTFGWNNAQLQANAGNVNFRATTVEVSETTWTCDRDAGPQTQERATTTTTSTEGLVDSIGRLKSQITGFNLLGYDGETTTTTETEGPPVGSCPTNWTAIDLVEGDPEIVSDGLEVSGDGGTTWTELLEKPI